LRYASVLYSYYGLKFIEIEKDDLAKLHVPFGIKHINKFIFCPVMLNPFVSIRSVA